jgi:AsmA-like C-terminal region
MNFSEASPNPSGKRQRYKRAFAISAMVAFILLGAAAAVLSAKWPFTAPKIRAELEEATSDTVHLRSFRMRYFPPGCVIEGIELRRPGNSTGVPLLTAGSLTIRANYRGLFGKRIEFMRLEDVRLNMGQRATNSNSGSASHRGGQSVKIAEIVVDRAVIEFPRKHRPPLEFNVHQLSLGNFVQGKPTSFHVTLDNPLPPGRVRADGQFGPLNTSDLAATALSGTYRFTNARLSSLGGIEGTLSSQGSFAGPARALRVQGTTDTPNYEVKSAGHRVHLRTEFQAMVNCANGDVDLRSIRGQFEQTTFGVAGDVAKKTKSSGKVALLQVKDPGGRVEDWLRLLASDQTPPMTGPIWFQAQVTIPGGARPFIQRVRLRGNFGLTDVAFTKEKTEQEVSELSLRAQGQKVADPQKQALPKVTGKIAGQVELLDGVAHFSNLTYVLPGAMAQLEGTYSFNDERIDLHGRLTVERKFSATATGPKGLLTRAIEPLIAKARGKGETLPVKLTGTYDHPSYGFDK